MYEPFEGDLVSVYPEEIHLSLERFNYHDIILWNVIQFLEGIPYLIQMLHLLHITSPSMLTFWALAFRLPISSHDRLQN